MVREPEFNIETLVFFSYLPSCVLAATIGFEQVTYTILEGSGSVEVAVLLLSGNLDDTSIEYTITTSPGTATGQSIYIPTGTLRDLCCICEHTENADYSPTALPSTGTISSSNTRSTHIFEIFNDTSTEPPETFFMHVMIAGTTPPSLNTSTDPDSATVRIIDDEGKFYQSLKLYSFFMHVQH